MAGVWKKTLQYLGLVEDEELEDLEEVDASGPHPETTPVRRIGRPEMISSWTGVPGQSSAKRLK